MTGSRYLPDSVKSRLNGICLKRGYHQMDEFAVKLRGKTAAEDTPFWGESIRSAACKVHPCGQRTGDLSDRRTAAGLQDGDAFGNGLPGTVSKEFTPTGQSTFTNARRRNTGAYFPVHRFQLQPICFSE